VDAHFPLYTHFSCEWESKDPSENLRGIFFIDYLAWCINTLRLNYQNANKRQKILLHRDLIFVAVLSPTIKIFHRHSVKEIGTGPTDWIE
jgi:hypothetical protein